MNQARGGGGGGGGIECVIIWYMPSEKTPKICLYHVLLTHLTVYQSLSEKCNQYDCIAITVRAEDHHIDSISIWNYLPSLTSL